MLIQLDFSSPVPIYVQLRNEIVRGIGKGDLQYGEALPTVRQLAQEIGINVMTVSKAYGILKEEGFITTDRRHGAKVVPLPDGHLQFSPRQEQELEQLAAEAAARGMGEEDFVEQCRRIYQQFSDGERIVPPGKRGEVR